MARNELLELLRCPETKQSVQYHEGKAIDMINAETEQGILKNRGCRFLQCAIEAGLLRKDRRFIYPILKGIPIMPIDEAIPFTMYDV